MYIVTLSPLESANALASSAVLGMSISCPLKKILPPSIEPSALAGVTISGFDVASVFTGASVSTFVSCLSSVPFGPCSTDSFRVSDPTDLSLSPAVSPSRTGLDPLSSCPLVTSLFLLYVFTASIPASRASTSNAEFLYSLYNFMYF